METGQYPLSHDAGEQTEEARVTEQSGAKVGLKSRSVWLQSWVPDLCAPNGPLRPWVLSAHPPQDPRGASVNAIHPYPAPELLPKPRAGPWRDRLRWSRQGGEQRGNESLRAHLTPPSPRGLTLDMLHSAVPPEDTLHRFSLCNGGHGSGSDPRGQHARSGLELQAGKATEEPSPWPWTDCGSGQKCGTSD